MVVENRDSIDLDIKGYLSAIKRRRSLGFWVFATTLALFAAMAPFLERNYVAEGKLLFQRTDETTSLTGVGAGGGQLESLLANQTPLGTEKAILTSHTFLQRVIDQVGLTDDKNKPLAVKDFRKKLKVEILGPTDVIQVAYQSPDARLATRTVDRLMEQYIQDSVAKQQRETGAAGEFMASQLPQIEVQLQDAESALQRFKETHAIVDLSQETQLITQGLEELDRRIVNLTADFNGISQQAVQLQSNLQLSFDQTFALNVLSRSPEIRGALDELAVVERELAEVQKIFLPSHPRVLAVRDKQALLENTIRSQLEQVLGTAISVPKGLLENRGDRSNLLESYIALEVERLKLSQQLSTLEQARSGYTNRASVMPQLEMTQAKLQRDVDLARNTYQTLLQKFQEVQLAENKSTSNAEIVQPAIVPDRGQTGRALLFVAGGLLGLLFSSVAILIAELRDHSLKTLGDIKGSFAYPLLGVIPTQAGRSGQLQHQEQQAFDCFLSDSSAPFLSEAYWMIQENIRFLSSQRSLKVLVVSSSVPGEGKSEVAANLAATMARQGRRVLLIDGDLRNPVQDQIWQLRSNQGLSHVLQAQAEFRPERSAKVENLRILAAGEQVDNPLHLLASQTMYSLVRSATHYFDHVIIDAPPLLQAADTLALGRLSDGMLLVTRPGVIDRQSTTKVKEILKKHEQTILGLVVNGVQQGYFPNAQYRNSQYRSSQYRSSDNLKTPMAHQS